MYSNENHETLHEKTPYLLHLSRRIFKLHYVKNSCYLRKLLNLYTPVTKQHTCLKLETGVLF